ncbi:MAG: hypothetical protein RIS47_392 [Bacteroidota bacterium]|jgi:hypothetical protein
MGQRDDRGVLEGEAEIDEVFFKFLSRRRCPNRGVYAYYFTGSTL